jgi:hypothetical protein
MRKKRNKSVNGNLSSRKASNEAVAVPLERFMPANQKRNTFISKTGRIISVGAVVGFTILGPITTPHSDAASRGTQMTSVENSFGPLLGEGCSGSQTSCNGLNLGCIMCQVSGAGIPCVCDKSVLFPCTWGINFGGGGGGE